MKDELKEHYKYKLKWTQTNLKNILAASPLTAMNLEQKLQLAEAYVKEFYDIFLEMGLTERLGKLENYRSIQKEEQDKAIEATTAMELNVNRLIKNLLED